MMNERQNQYVAEKSARPQLAQPEFNSCFEARYINQRPHDQRAAVGHEHRSSRVHTQRIVERIDNDARRKSNEQYPRLIGLVRKEQNAGYINKAKRIIE